MKRLPNTAYAVLGLLISKEAKSGYEVRKSAETLRYFYWSPAQSQIYSELRRLAALNYVTSELVPQRGKPDKRLYQITTAGVDAFTNWVNHAQLEPTMMKHAVQLRLFFGESAETEHLTALLQQYIDESTQALGQIAIVREFSELDEAYRWRGVVAAWSEARLEAEVEFATNLLRQLQAGELSS
ncbi:MAG: PadR family transcriptional regulator [Candidatus Promineifilaceae bacterium]